MATASNKYYPLTSRIKMVVSQLAKYALSQGDRASFHVFEYGRETVLSYETLLRQASTYAAFLRDAGVLPGDLVFLCLKHGVDPYMAYLGSMILGAIPSFLAFPTPKQDSQLYWESHRSLFHKMRGRSVITYQENAADLSVVLPPETRLLIKPTQIESDSRPLAEIIASLPICKPEDIALVQFSSGTTGLRKGVSLSHEQIAYQADGYAAAIGAVDGIRVASWLPLYHDMGLMTSFLIPVFLGGTVVSLDPFEWVNDPHSLFIMMDRYACTHAWLPNFTFNHLVRTKTGDETYRLDHIKALINCSEPCKRATFDSFTKAFASQGIRPDQLQTCYGMAETVFAISQSQMGEPPRTLWVDAEALAENRLELVDENTKTRMALLSNGPAIEGIEIRIAEGPVGEIQVRGRYVFDGYLKSPELTAEVFDDGWYRTGDIGCLVDDEVYIVGRVKDIIIYHGRNYYAHDIEAAAAAVAGVKAGRCAAMGVWSDAVGSEEIELVTERDLAVAVDEPVLKTSIKQAIALRLNLAVSRIHVVDPGWLVKTTSGKISRKENLAKLLREREHK